jgi:hypothetical protein
VVLAVVELVELAQVGHTEQRELLIQVQAAVVRVVAQHKAEMLMVTQVVQDLL